MHVEGYCNFHLHLKRKKGGLTSAVPSFNIAKPLWVLISILGNLVLVYDAYDYKLPAQNSCASFLYLQNFSPNCVQAQIVSSLYQPLSNFCHRVKTHERNRRRRQNNLTFNASAVFPVLYFRRLRRLKQKLKRLRGLLKRVLKRSL